MGSLDRRTLEEAAELRAAFQLDLLAQLEVQLRGVHHTMRRIERLRSAIHRSGPEPSNGERRDALAGLSDELAALEQQIATQRQSVEQMQRVVDQMQARMSRLRPAAHRALPRIEDEGASSPPGES